MNPSRLKIIVLQSVQFACIWLKNEAICFLASLAPIHHRKFFIQCFEFVSEFMAGNQVCCRQLGWGCSSLFLLPRCVVRFLSIVLSTSGKKHSGVLFWLVYLHCHPRHNAAQGLNDMRGYSPRWLSWLQRRKFNLGNWLRVPYTVPRLELRPSGCLLKCEIIDKVEMP